MASDRKYYEDFPGDFSIEYTVPGLTTAEIMEFAVQFDPQRFHLDEVAAAETHFGSLVASGFHTQLQCFLPFCKEVLLDSMAVGAPGIDSLRWLRPWYPDEDLEVIVRLVNRRLSSGQRGRGYLTFNMMASRQGIPTLEMDWSVIFLTRSDNN